MYKQFIAIYLDRYIYALLTKYYLILPLLTLLLLLTLPHLRTYTTSKCQ